MTCGAAEGHACREWPLQAIPRVGEEILGFAVEEVLPDCYVTNVGYRIDDPHVHIWAAPTEHYKTADEMQAALDELGQVGWKVHSYPQPV